MLSNFTLRQIEYFVAAAEAGSTIKAAQNLHMSQSSMSSALTELDSALGVQLFVRRRGKGLELTSAGDQLLPRARHLLRAASELEAVTKASQDENSGMIRVGCYDVIAPAYLPTAFTEYRNRYPGVHIEITETTQQGLITALEGNSIDVALTYLRGLPTSLSTITVARPLPHLLVPASHPMAELPETTLADVRDEEFILLDANPGRELILDLFATSGVEPTIVYASSNFDHVRALVSAGLGVSIISQVPGHTPPHWSDEVVAVPLTDADRHNELVMAYLKDGPLDKRIRNFIQLSRWLFTQ